MNDSYHTVCENHLGYCPKCKKEKIPDCKACNSKRTILTPGGPVTLDGPCFAHAKKTNLIKNTFKYPPITKIIKPAVIRMKKIKIPED